MTKKNKRARLLSMDELHTRPCEVDGTPAIFHRWVEEYDLEALVEFPDGTIGRVKPELIRFVDQEAQRHGI